MSERVYSAPGRTELGGNHTDHQHGCVLAAAVALFTTARVRQTGEPVIRIRSEGYGPVCIDLKDLNPRPQERGSTAALVRGVAAGFAAAGATLPGFEAHVTSEVLPGSGLSSSAAFEVLMGRIINDLSGIGLDAVRIAAIGQAAENRYFGKPCGLMDQLASSLGGTVFIDFADPAHPRVEQLQLDPEKAGYALCILDTGGSHADLTQDYAAIPHELSRLCACFGVQTLRQLPRAEFDRALPRLRGQVPDRALLRAIHVYDENLRVEQQAQALRAGDLQEFFRLVRASGQSSWMYLQNINPAGAIEEQPMALALALCEQVLGERGAYRVHGGGFAGTVQAFVPLELLDTLRQTVEPVFGPGSCRVLKLL